MKMKLIVGVLASVMALGLTVRADNCAKSCCDKAKAKGEECKHECCVKAKADGKTCEKCNKSEKCEKKKDA